MAEKSEELIVVGVLKFLREFVREVLTPGCGDRKHGENTECHKKVVLYKPP